MKNHFDLKAFHTNQSVSFFYIKKQEELVAFEWHFGPVGVLTYQTYGDFQPEWNKMWFNGLIHLSDTSLHRPPMINLLSTLLIHLWVTRRMTVLLCCWSRWIRPIRATGAALFSFDACFIESASQSGLLDNRGALLSVRCWCHEPQTQFWNPVPFWFDSDSFVCDSLKRSSSFESWLICFWIRLLVALYVSLKH